MSQEIMISVLCKISDLEDEDIPIDRQAACIVAQESVEEALNHAMGRGFNHRHDDSIGVCIESVAVDGLAETIHAEYLVQEARMAVNHPDEIMYVVGEKVYWHDPNQGRFSGHYTIVAKFPISGVLQLQNEAGEQEEVYPHEITK